MRWVRLGMGILAITQGIALHNIFIGAIGILFAGMALANAGCCSLPRSNNFDSRNDEVIYEEVKHRDPRS